MIYELSLVQWVYRNSPVFLQNGLVSLYGALQRWERTTPRFRRIFSELQTTEKMSLRELEDLQNGLLQRLIRHVYDNVPYYRRIFKERGLKPSDIQTPVDLYKLPLLTKQQVRASWDELRAVGIPRHKVRVARTGGTTGIPLSLLLDKECLVFDHALVLRHWSWAGYRPGARVAILRGLPLVSPEQKSCLYWRVDYLDNRLYMSSFHLSAETFSDYVNKLFEWRPDFIAAYPSSLFLLARFMQRQNVRIPVRAVFTSSEVLTGYERAVIEDRFECRVWDRYGTGERLVVTQQCEFGNYHQNVEFGVLQVDAPLGKPARSGEKGALVLTGLRNFAMPLIRYVIEDVGSIQVGNCPCGRQLPLCGPVEGRKDDIIVTAEGRLMPRAGLDQIHEYVKNVERCQLVQRRVGEVILRVQSQPGFERGEREVLMRELRKRIGASTRVILEEVEKLELTPTGKERFIVSEVDVENMLEFR
jgi:phenylacetate-CoA ligase